MVTGVEFDEDKFGYSRPGVSQRSAAPGMYGADASSMPGMAGWLIRHGFAKSGRAAQNLLIVIVLLNVIITFVVIKYFL